MDMLEGHLNRYLIQILRNKRALIIIHKRLFRKSSVERDSD
jgi:hypothetical protein